MGFKSIVHAWVNDLRDVLANEPLTVTGPMAKPNFALRALVEPDRCWGRVVGEDSDQGACQLCVETCPEVFEKPLANRCAQVRPTIDAAQYVARIRRVVKICPVGAIRLVKNSRAVRSDSPHR